MTSGARMLAPAIAAGLLVALATPFFATAADGPSDAWLTTTTKIAVLTSLGTQGTTVQVMTANQTVTLFGKVTSPEDRRFAETVTWGIEGVKGVRNLLQVAPFMPEKAVGVPDSMLQREVNVALVTAGLKGGVPGKSSISVQSADEGTVLLVGTAENLTAHLQAIEAAKSIPGVRAVRSEVRSPDVRAVYEPRFLGQRDGRIAYP